MTVVKILFLFKITFRILRTTHYFVKNDQLILYNILDNI